MTQPGASTSMAPTPAHLNQKTQKGESDDDKNLNDSVRFQTLLNKLHAHAADHLHSTHPAPYNKQFIDTLHLWPAARLPGAPLAEVCMHFRKHHAVILDPSRMYDPDYWDTPEYQKTGAKYDFCLVIDDESLKSIDSGPEPIGPTPPEGMKGWEIAGNASKVFVKLLSKSGYSDVTRLFVS